MQNANIILDRIKDAYKMASDVDLAFFFGVKPPTVSTWRSRNSVPFELIIAKCESQSLDWIFKGSRSPIVAEEQDPYISSVVTTMRAMDDNTKKDIQFSVEKEKLLRDLIKERQEKTPA